MPKAEKELRKELTPLEQKIKRKTIDPGLPSDTEPWTGATETKYRHPTINVPEMALGIVKKLSNIQTQIVMSILKGLSFDSLTNRSIFRFLDLNLASAILFYAKTTISNELTLQDVCTLELNP